MNISAYTTLHYGKAYLRWAVAAVAPVVDRHIILYTPSPSFGYGTDLVCPDTEEELRECVAEFDHVEWHTGQYANESQHRAAVLGVLPQNTDILLPVDADEVWDLCALAQMLKHVYDGAAHEWRLYGFEHYWRSFNWFCTDGMAPVRAIDLRQNSGIDYAQGRVAHFGYAQSVEIMRYKWAIHGHRAELRTDCDWLNDKYINWRPGDTDVHPTCKGIWFPKEIKKPLPPILNDHPWKDLELIV